MTQVWCFEVGSFYNFENSSSNRLKTPQTSPIYPCPELKIEIRLSSPRIKCSNKRSRKVCTKPILQPAVCKLPEIDLKKPLHG